MIAPLLGRERLTPDPGTDRLGIQAARSRNLAERVALGKARLDLLITLHLVDEILDVDLHGRTPVRDRGMGCRQYTLSSHAKTLESNKSDASNSGSESCTGIDVVAGLWAVVLII
jgi:hypothetical protein